MVDCEDAGRALQGPVAAKLRRARGVGRCTDLRARQCMNAVDECQTVVALTYVATPEFDVGVSGKMVTPRRDFACVARERSSLDRRIAQLNLARLAVGEKLDCSEIRASLERGCNLFEPIAVRIDQHDLHILRDALREPIHPS